MQFGFKEGVRCTEASLNYFLNLVSEGECSWLLNVCIQVLKHKCFTLAHFPENLMPHKEPVRAEYLLSSCTKLISIVYLSS